MFVKHFENRILERPATSFFADCENRSEGHVQKLPAPDFVEVNRFVRFGFERTQGLDLGGSRRDVIALAVGFEAAAGKSDDFAEQLRSNSRNDAKRLEVTGSRSFHMKQIATDAAGDRVDREFVGAAVDAEFVRT